MLLFHHLAISALLLSSVVLHAGSVSNTVTDKTFFFQNQSIQISGDKNKQGFVTARARLQEDEKMIEMRNDVIQTIDKSIIWEISTNTRDELVLLDAH